MGAQESVGHLSDLFSMFRTPKIIISDGKAFTNKQFKTFVNDHIKHVLNSVASPRSNEWQKYP